MDVARQMPEQAQLDEFLGALEASGGHSANGNLRELLLWDEPTYDAVKAERVAKGIGVTGRGRGGSVALAGANTQPSQEPKAHSTSTRTMNAASSPPGPQPNGKQNLSSFIWSVADLLRGDYKRSDFGLHPEVVSTAEMGSVGYSHLPIVPVAP